MAGISNGILRAISDPFGGALVFEVATTAPNETVTIPCQNIGVFNALMDHGDGNISTITTFDDADLAHEYTTAGTHRVSITGSFPSIFFNNGGDKAKVKRVLNIGDTNLLSLNSAFYGCALDSFIAGDNANTPNLTRIDNAVRQCTSLIVADFRGLDTGETTLWGSMCRDTPSLQTIHVNDLDTSKATNLLRTFLNVTSLLVLSGVEGWDISSVTSFLGFASGTTIATPT